MAWLNARFVRPIALVGIAAWFMFIYAWLSVLITERYPRNAYDFLVQSVCAGPDGAALPGVTPLDSACTRPRKLQPGEALPYHKQDWPGREDRARRPDGYQRSDSFPVRLLQGLAVFGSGAVIIGGNGSNGNGSNGSGSSGSGSGGTTTTSSAVRSIVP